MIRKTIVNTLGVGALALSTAIASTITPLPVDIAACSVASRAELLQVALPEANLSHIAACRTAQ